MEEQAQQSQQPTMGRPPRNKFWAGFSAGLLTGILIAIAFYFIDKAMNDPVRILLPELPTTEQEAPAEKEGNDDNLVKTFIRKSSNKPEKVVVEMDSSELLPADTLIEEAEFALELDADNDAILLEKAVATRQIAVKTLEEKGAAPTIHSFIVEEWVEFAKNKHSYKRKGNVLKIKGLKIANMRIFYQNEQYYLENNGRYYAIPECDDFRRLQEVANPNTQE